MNICFNIKSNFPPFYSGFISKYFMCVVLKSDYQKDVK